MSQKIMFFTPSLNVGGMERISLTYAKALSKKYSITYVVCHIHGAFTQEVDGSINLINLNTGRLKHSVNHLARVIKTINPSYIITANDATMIVVLSKWIARSSVRIISFQHSYITDEESNTFRSKLIIKFFFRFCYKIIAVSHGINRMLTRLGLSPYKVKTILNPIDFERIIVRSNDNVEVPDRYIVFVGRLSPVKNLHFLIEAYNVYLKLRGTLKLVIVGDGVEKNKLMSLSSHLGISDFVLFMGEQCNPYPIINKATIVVLPSFSEALPTILIEALVLGKTIVATPTEGAKEILQYKYGYITNSFDDKDEFANLIIKAENNSIPSCMLHEVLSNYDINSRIKDFESVL